MSDIANHDDYLAQVATSLQPSLVKLREQIRTYLPDADEIISYNMPGYSIDNKIIVGYAAFSKQCGIYLHPKAIVSLSKEIAAAGFHATKTGITFNPSKPLPEKLIEKLVLTSRKNHGY